MNSKLNEGESVIKEGSANYFNSWGGVLGTSAGGKLYLTNQRILFEGHGLNVGREFVVINIKDIVNCSTGFPNTLTILANDNQEFKFAVRGKKNWENEIRSFM